MTENMRMKIPEADRLREQMCDVICEMQRRIDNQKQPKGAKEMRKSKDTQKRVEVVRAVETDCSRDDGMDLVHRIKIIAGIAYQEVLSTPEKDALMQIIMECCDTLERMCQERRTALERMCPERCTAPKEDK